MKNKVEDECGMMQISVGNPAVVFRTHTDFGHSWSCPLLCQPQKGLHSNAFQCIQLLCAYWLTSSFFIYTVSNPLCLQKEAAEFLETALWPSSPGFQMPPVSQTRTCSLHPCWHKTSNRMGPELLCPPCKDLYIKICFVS